MELRKKNKTIVIIILLCVVACGIGIYLKNWNSIENTSSNKTGYEQAAEALDVDFNADIIVYKDAPKFIDEVKYRTIDKITEENLKYNEPHGYRAIVIYDKNGNITISDDELLIIKKYVEKKGYDMFYIGKQYLDDFERLKFTKGCESDEASLEYIGSYKTDYNVQQNEYGNMYAEHGLWCDGDEEALKNNKDKIQSRMIMLMWDYARKAAGENN